MIVNAGGLVLGHLQQQRVEHLDPVLFKVLFDFRLALVALLTNVYFDFFACLNVRFFWGLLVELTGC